MQRIHFKVSVAIAIFLLFGLIIIIAPSPVWADQADASTAISSAKNTILDCYKAAKQAETAGANITVLVGTLNEAGSLLSRAELAYAKNDFDTARNLAIQSRNTLNNLIGEANTLKVTATQQQNQDFLTNVVGSTIGALAVIVAGLAVLFLLKRKYKNE